MSFMNAKEARPVDDPKALVPFGWAPGNYHCAACSICGEAHSGSDKRSMRCQDCAETLRDKQAAEPAPTPRETADHAELAAIEETVIENLRIRGMRSAGKPAIQDVFDALDEWKGIADQEFAARTGAREEATKYKRLLGDLLCIIHRDGGQRIEAVGLESASEEAVKISAALLSEIAALRGERDRLAEELHNEIMVCAGKSCDADVAERQRDEAVGLLRDVVCPGWTRQAWSDARAFLARLANQGADQ